MMVKMRVLPEQAVKMKVGTDLIELPEEIDDLITKSTINFKNKRVKSIANNVFSYNHNLVSVDAPNVEVIKSQAFKECDVLTDVSVPKCKEIRDEGFINAIALKGLELPAENVKIGNSCFQDCTALTEVVAPNMTQIGNNAFRNCVSLTVANYPNARIGNYAFSNCTYLKDVTVSGYFGNVPSLTTGEVVNSASGALPFEYCPNIKNLTLALVDTFYSADFQNLSTLNTWTFKRISMPSIVDKTDDNIYYFFGNYDYTIRLDTPTAHFSNIEEIYFPNLTRRIPYRPFWKNTSLKKMTVGTIGSIQGEAFFDSSIEEFYGDVGTIGDGAFRGCTSLRRFNSEQDGVCIIGSNQINASAFQGCDSITKFAVGWKHGGMFTTLKNINAIPTGAIIYIPYYERYTYYNDSVWSKLSDRMQTYMDISDVYSY